MPAGRSVPVFVVALALSAALMPTLARASARQAGPAHHQRAAERAHAARVEAQAHGPAESRLMRPGNHHEASFVACQERWGRELGTLLCPRMFAAEGAATVGAAGMEWSLLQAVYHICRQHLGATAAHLGGSWAAVQETLRALWREDPL